jgi:hypothetical protein
MDEFQKVREHLKSCHLCQIELRELTTLNGFLSSYEEEEVPEYINQRILTTIESTAIHPQRVWFTRRVVNFSIAASVLISFAAGVFMSNQAFAQNNDSDLEFGQETLFSMYYEGE